MKHHPAWLAAGLLVLVVLACSMSEDANKSSSTPQSQAPPGPVANASPMHIAGLVKEFEGNEIRAKQEWVGKRVRVYGTINRIEAGDNGNIVLDFKSSVSTYKTGRCFFNESQSSRVAGLNAHEEATVEGTVRGLGGGFDNSKAFLVLEDCTVP